MNSGITKDSDTVVRPLIANLDERLLLSLEGHKHKLTDKQAEILYAECVL